MTTKTSAFLRPADLARFLGMNEGHGLYIPKLEAIARAVGLSLEALEDVTGEDWSSAGVEVAADGVTLHFRLRRSTPPHRRPDEPFPAD